MESTADLRARVGTIDWKGSKTLAAVLLILRLALNFYSTITNVDNLPKRDTQQNYDLAKRIVFIFEMCAVRVVCGLSLFASHMGREFVRTAPSPPPSSSPLHSSLRTPPSPTGFW